MQELWHRGEELAALTKAKERLQGDCKTVRCSWQIMGGMFDPDRRLCNRTWQLDKTPSFPFTRTLTAPADAQEQQPCSPHAWTGRY